MEDELGVCSIWVVISSKVVPTMRDMVVQKSDPKLA